VLKEKEQLNRVSNYKLSELKRAQRSTQVDKLNIAKLQKERESLDTHDFYE